MTLKNLIRIALLTCFAGTLTSPALASPPMPRGMIEIGGVNEFEDAEAVGPELRVLVGAEVYGAQNQGDGIEVRWFWVKGQMLLTKDMNSLPVFDFTIVPVSVYVQLSPVGIRVLNTEVRRNIFIGMDRRVILHVAGFTYNRDFGLAGSESGVHLDGFLNASLELLGLTYAAQSETGREFWGASLIDSTGEAGLSLGVKDQLSLRVALIGLRAPMVHFGVKTTGPLGERNGEFVLNEYYSELSLNFRTALGQYSLFAQGASLSTDAKGWIPGQDGAEESKFRDEARQITLRIGVRAGVR